MASGAFHETSIDVAFSTELWKSARLTAPQVETAAHIISVGRQAAFASTLDHARRLATTDMVRWLTEESKLEPWAAHLPHRALHTNVAQHVGLDHQQAHGGSATHCTRKRSG